MEKTQRNGDRGTIQLPRDTHRKLKIMAAVSDRTIGDIVAEMVEESVARLPQSDPRLAQVLSN